MLTRDRGDVAKVLIAGAMALAAMELFMRLIAPALGLPRIDVPAIIARDAFGGRLVLGWIAHVILGVIVFPLALLVLRRWFARVPLPLLGLGLGWALFLLGEGLLIPLTGGGFFSSADPTWPAIVLEDLLAHTVYGLTLGAALRLLKREH